MESEWILVFLFVCRYLNSKDKMMKKKEEIVKQLTGGIEYLFKKNKVDYVKGLGTIKDGNTVLAKTLDGKEQSISAKNIMIATGSEVIKLPFLPLDEEVFVSSTGKLISFEDRMIILFRSTRSEEGSGKLDCHWSRSHWNRVRLCL